MSELDSLLIKWVDTSDPAVIRHIVPGDGVWKLMGSPNDPHTVMGLMFFDVTRYGTHVECHRMIDNQLELIGGVFETTT